MTYPLTGQTILITGGAKRIGRELALTLARAGGNIAFTYSASQDEAETTLRDLTAIGIGAIAVHCELRNPEDIRKAVAAIFERFGRLDILVNNAGIFESAPLETISTEAWDRMYETNTRGPFLMAQACHPHLRLASVRGVAGGRIINIGSLGGIHPWATHAHYCTSKAALHMLSQTMAKAWAPEISVNCIAPGMIVQGEVGAGYEDFARKTPMQRNGTAADVAAAALFFATGPHFITGQLLAVDGGLGL